MTKLREKIGLGLAITGLVASLTGSCGREYIEFEAKDELNTGARYVQMIESNREFANAYPQVNVLYQQLKADPEVQEAISNYENKQDNAKNFTYGSLAGLGLAVVGIALVLKKSKKEDQ